MCTRSKTNVKLGIRTMTLPKALAPLVALPAWVIWRRELRDGKSTKPPRQPKAHERYASSGDPATWGTYAEARGIVPLLRPWQGVGFNLLDSGIVGIDLDKCVDDEGHVTSRALEIIERCGSYTELSPSGRGVHILGLAKSTQTYTLLHGLSDGSKLEAYRNCKRYLTVTGVQLNSNGLVELDDVLAELQAELQGSSGAAHNGKGGEGADSSRSGVFHKVVCKLFDKGLEPSEVEHMYRTKPKLFEGTKAKSFDEEGRLLPEIERCYGKWRAEKGAQLEVKWSNGRLPQKNCADARIAVEALGIRCSYDAFHLRPRMEGEALGRWSGEISDNGLSYLRYVMGERFLFDPGKLNLEEAVNQLCVVNTFDPLVDYLTAVRERWDGEERLDDVAVTHLGCADNELNRMIMRKAMIAACRRVFHPGAKFDQIIVLEGPEGTLKSTAILTLAGPENFSDQSILGLPDLKQQEALCGRWLYEIADLKGIYHTDVESVKAFASRTEDRARPAYGHYLVNQKRRTILFASTNDKKYLKGDTGNRRFWPLITGRISINWLRRDRDQLWAEAAVAEARGESLDLPKHLWADAKKAQDARLEDHPWLPKLQRVKGRHFPSPDHPGEIEERVSSEELLDDIIKIPAERQRGVDGKIVKELMTRLGWEYKEGQRVVKGGSVVGGYRRLVGAEDKVIDFDEARRRREEEGE